MRNFLGRTWLLPPVCVLCDAFCDPGATIDLCLDCLGDLPANRFACARCAEPLGVPESGLACGECLRKAPRFHNAICAFQYAYPLDHLLRALKFHGRIAYARVLGQLLARELSSRPRDAWPTLLLPVPLSESRFRERGFNQAIEISAALEEELHIPVRADLSLRVRATREQTGLDARARRKNLRGAFVLRHKIEARHVAIVDDVITTGSTMNELARTLRRAGVQRVEAWAVAKTPRR